MNARICSALKQSIEDNRPESVLILSPSVPECITDYATANPQVVVEHIVLENLDHTLGQLKRYDFAFVAETLEKLERAQALHLISRLRDLHVKLLWVLLPENASSDNFQHKDAIAQGLRRVESKGGNNMENRLYEFSLQFYKPVPQWLNSENWANPQEWNKRRW